MKAKDILGRLAVAAPVPGEPRVRPSTASAIPIVGEIEAMHRGAVAELKDLKARRLVTLEVAPTEIDTGGFRDRDYRFLVDEAFEDLVASIAREGQLQPILVRRRRSGPAFDLVVGLRRLKACERLGIPVQAKEIDADDRAILLAMIAENEIREDISAIERSRQIKAILEAGVLTQTEIATVLGRHKSLVSRLLALSEIPPAIIRAIGDPRAMPLRLGYSIAQLCRSEGTLKAMLAEAERLADAEGMTTAERVETLIAAAQRVVDPGPPAAPKPTPKPGVKRPARRLATLAAAVKVRDRSGGRPLISLTDRGPGTATVLRLAPELGRDFADALMHWVLIKFQEMGRPVEIDGLGAATETLNDLLAARVPTEPVG